ncbi:MAG: FAD-dependent oxidoreductase [Catenulispora sp.]
MKVVVVGNGMAGCRFVQELLERTDRFDVTVVGDEPGGAYNRILLSNVLAGATRADATTIAGEEWYAERGVTLRSGTAVVAVDRGARTVRLADGTSLPYDRLVLATGSTAFVPPTPGLRRDDGSLIAGAALFRTREDCTAIDAWAARATRAVVVGAGVLGLEAARALAGRGLAVTVVQREDRLMERQLDAAAGRVLGRTLGRLGIDVVAGASVAAVHGGDPVSEPASEPSGIAALPPERSEGVTGVTLTDGSSVAAELIVLCCGVRPRVDLAREAGLDVGHGVRVDDRMHTADPAVLAIGECAEHRGRLYGLVAPVWEQARVAAAVLADPSSPARYAGSTMVTRLKAAGIELAAMGDDSPRDETDDAADDTEFVTFVDRNRGVYQKLVVQDGRLVGAILLGDTRNAGTVTQLFERGAALPIDRSALLMVRRNAPAATTTSPTALPARATICQCNGVTKGAITSAWQAGARSVEEIAAQTRATTGCGTCRDTVCGLVDWLAEADAQAEPA